MNNPTVFLVSGDEDTGDLLELNLHGVPQREAICTLLSRLERDKVLELDFTFIRYLDTSCANEVVVQVLRRLESGEYPDVSIYLSGIARQHRGNIDMALKAAKKAVIVRDGYCDYIVLGKLKKSHMVALCKVIELESMTARELQKAMDYKTVNEASTKLSCLYKHCLLRRKEAAGRSFRYISLLKRDAW